MRIEIKKILVRFFKNSIFCWFNSDLIFSLKNMFFFFNLNENVIFQNKNKNIFITISCFEMRTRLIGKNDFTRILANENSRHSLVQNNFHFPGRCFTLMKHLFKTTRINLFSALQTSELELHQNIYFLYHIAFSLYRQK